MYHAYAVLVAAQKANGLDGEQELSEHDATVDNDTEPVLLRAVAVLTGPATVALHAVRFHHTWSSCHLDLEEDNGEEGGHDARVGKGNDSKYGVEALFPARRVTSRQYMCR